MKYSQLTVLFVALCASLLAATAAAAGDGSRTVLARADLDGAPGMEYIVTLSEYRPGDSIARHFHHGVETGYVLQGGRVQAPGKDPVDIPTGAVLDFARGEHHAGFTIVGDTPLRIFTTHVVDKGKPLYDYVE